MSQSVSLFSMATVGLTAFVLVSVIFMSADLVQASEASSAKSPSCTCPENGRNASGRPKLAGLNTPLDEADENAALESLQFALSEVADGSSYVWHRSHGRLSGIVKPIGSFKGKQGAVCRTILVVLNSAEHSKKTQAIACRLRTGVWQLEG